MATRGYATETTIPAGEKGKLTLNLVAPHQVRFRRPARLWAGKKADRTLLLTIILCIAYRAVRREPRSPAMDCLAKRFLERGNVAFGVPCLALLDISLPITLIDDIPLFGTPFNHNFHSGTLYDLDAPSFLCRPRLVSRHQTFYSRTVVQQVNLTTSDGDIGILADHVPIVEQLVPGVVEVLFEGGKSEKVFGAFF